MTQGYKLVLFFLLSTVYSAQAQFWDFSPAYKLSETVNSNAEESMPMFSKDSSILYFVRTFDASNSGGSIDQDIWYSTKNQKGFYGKSEKLITLNNKLNNAVCGMNADGNSLYLINCYEGKHPKESGIAIAQKKGGSWGKPKSLKIPALKIKGDFINFYVSQDENVIILSYAGMDSQGKEDLYLIKKQVDGSWSNPLNLGTSINSSGFEISPFLSQGLDTLYFSTNGRGGMGDADIFYSIRQDDSWTNWSEPENMGDKINSSKFDAYLIASENQFYWSSNREGDKSDIYFTTRLYPPAITLSVMPIISTVPKKGHAIDLTVNGGGKRLKYNWSNNDTVQDPQNLQPGVYKVRVSDEYGQEAFAEVNIDAPVFANEQEITASKDDVFNKELKNNIIYYDENSSYLNRENKVVLDKIIPILNSKPELKIFIQSFCDKNGTNHYNYWLSERRMKRVIAYLEKNGVDKGRLSGDYKGESSPLINCKNCNEEQLRLNRRTVIKFKN
jgi:outer membrane protein OmpA-like peptidoglycan-associated protein